MNTKRRIKKGPIIFIGIIVLVLIILVAGVKTYKHFTSYEYKLGKIGYSETEIASLVKADNKVLEKALETYNS